MAFSSPKQVFWFVREALWYVKTKTKSLFVVSKSRLGAFLGHLGAILEPSWGHLGALLESSFFHLETYFD